MGVWVTKRPDSGWKKWDVIETVELKEDNSVVWWMGEKKRAVIVKEIDRVGGMLSVKVGVFVVDLRFSEGTAEVQYFFTGKDGVKLVGLPLVPTMKMV
jgi:hypothetical protein